MALLVVGGGANFGKLMGQANYSEGPVARSPGYHPVGRDAASQLGGIEELDRM